MLAQYLLRHWHIITKSVLYQKKPNKLKTVNEILHQVYIFALIYVHTITLIVNKLLFKLFIIVEKIIQIIKNQPNGI